MRIDIRMLGGFEVEVDGAPVGAAAFEQRRGADLVKLLAIAPAHRLARDQVVERLWPQLAPEAGAANLHKAAHHARRALGARDAVVLAQGMVSLAPDGQVTTDVERFEAGDDAAYRGELLPDDRYEAWCASAREHVRALRLERLRAAGRWHDVLADDPADEEAHRALMRADLAAGNRVAASRRFGELRDELARLGLQPSEETLELHREAGQGEAVVAARALRGPVVGRDAQLAEAVRALRLAGEGQGMTLLVTGAAGMGKTRFAEALLQGAERRGMHTLRGTARSAEVPVPYLPLVEALDPLLLRRGDLLARLGAGSRGALAMLTPAAGTTGAEAPVQRHHLLTAIAHLLREAAGERGLVLVLEDLHAADDATLRLVDFLSAAARREPLVVVATARPSAGPSDALWRSLVERRAAREVVLGPLDADAVRTIAVRAAGADLGEDATAALVEAAAGNPFYAHELAAAAGPGGTLRVPERLQDLVDAPLATLEPLARGLLPALSVLDDGARADDLAAVAGTGTADTAHGLAAAAAAGVLEQDGAGGWGFRHPLLREAALRRVDGAELAATHARAADHLAQAGGAPERIAHHLLEAGRGEDAVAWLQAAAARAASVAAYADGRRWVEQALAHARPEDQPALYALLGDLRFATGDRAALTAYATAMRRAPEGTAADLRIKQARAAVALGDLETAERALDGLAPGGLAEARAEVVRAMVAWHRGDIDAAERHVHRAGEFEEAGGDEVEMLTDVRAMVAHASGRFETHIAWELTESWHVPQLAGRVFDAYLCVTEYALQAASPYDQLIAFARDLHAQAERSGARRGQAFSATVLGEALLLTGDVEGAQRSLREAIRISREVSAVGGEALARARLGEALAAAGDPVAAIAQLEEALELSRATPLAVHLLYIVYAALIATHADPAVALATVDVAEVVLADQQGCRFCPLLFDIAAASACARAGDVRRAAGFVDAAVEASRVWPPGLWSPAISEARADVALAAADRAQAEVLLRRAVDGYATTGQRLHEARAAARLDGLDAIVPTAG
ncbi:ATP-binding protein [Capillimicrobium parvum]|uniref:Bacterial transcriptional activator domain-containing protein n=1 Tax=Capillimicrobium parvum TaxID=2884022 RepID=A0A9E6XVZ4_9ACTN|nr:AAA family ATPase [Capillimicrobium parvum]UGS35215.1 hypothetical protein DSM104329_01600 [Capillimicrobium parvum]